MRVERSKQYPNLVRVFPAIGERVPVVGSYSEVMMHFRLADKPVEVSMEYQIGWKDGEPYPLIEHRLMCQVWKGGEKFSGPILPGEGGFYDCTSHGEEVRPGECGYYVYADQSRLPADVLAQPEE